MAMESASVVRLSKLSKRYGSYRALTDVAFEIEPGEVFGYLGPNGAGKTTTIRILLGLLRPSSGCATVFGMDSWRDRVRIHARTGYVPGEPGFWDRLTGVETLTYLARLRDSRGQVARVARSPPVWIWTSNGRCGPSRVGTSRSWPWSRR